MDESSSRRIQKIRNVLPKYTEIRINSAIGGGAIVKKVSEH